MMGLGFLSVSSGASGSGIYPEIDSTKTFVPKIMNNQRHACILETHHYLSVYNVHFKLASSTE